MHSCGTRWTRDRLYRFVFSSSCCLSQSGQRLDCWLSATCAQKQRRQDLRSLSAASRSWSASRAYVAASSLATASKLEWEPWRDCPPTSNYRRRACWGFPGTARSKPVCWRWWAEGEAPAWASPRFSLHNLESGTNILRVLPESGQAESEARAARGWRFSINSPHQSRCGSSPAIRLCPDASESASVYWRFQSCEKFLSIEDLRSGFYCTLTKWIVELELRNHSTAKHHQAPTNEVVHWRSSCCFASSV